MRNNAEICKPTRDLRKAPQYSDIFNRRAAAQGKALIPNVAEISCVIIVYVIKVAAMQTTKVGIREFRENLADYLESKTPVAITRHGSTIGIYVPTKPKPSQADLEALRVAGERMQELIAAAGTSEDEIVADFKKARSERRTRKG